METVLSGVNCQIFALIFSIVSLIRVDYNGDCCEHGNEPSGYINCGEIVDQLSDHQLFKESVSHGAGGWNKRLVKYSLFSKVHN
jgi:hypothetical protein